MVQQCEIGTTQVVQHSQACCQHWFSCLLPFFLGCCYGLFVSSFLLFPFPPSPVVAMSLSLSPADAFLQALFSSLHVLHSLPSFLSAPFCTNSFFLSLLPSSFLMVLVGSVACPKCNHLGELKSRFFSETPYLCVKLGWEVG